MPVNLGGAQQHGSCKYSAANWTRPKASIRCVFWCALLLLLVLSHVLLVLPALLTCNHC